MLEGRLVRLRAHEADSAALAQGWLNDREVTRYVSDRYPLSSASEEAWFRELAANGFGGVHLMIEAKGGGPIGFIYLSRVRPEDRKAELGIIIGEKKYWSKGYGTDAVTTLLRFAFDEMNFHRVWLTTLEYNERALACYRKCGFSEEGRLRQEIFKFGRYLDFIIMGVLRHEFRVLHGEVEGAVNA